MLVVVLAAVLRKIAYFYVCGIYRIFQNRIPGPAYCYLGACQLVFH